MINYQHCRYNYIFNIHKRQLNLNQHFGSGLHNISSKGCRIQDIVSLLSFCFCHVFLLIYAQPNIYVTIIYLYEYEAQFSLSCLYMLVFTCKLFKRSLAATYLTLYSLINCLKIYESTTNGAKVSMKRLAIHLLSYYNL